MQVDVQTISSLHLQRSLNTGGRKRGLRRVRRNGPFHQPANFRKFGFCVIIFLRIVVARNPEGCMVASHGKLSTLLLNHEIVQVLLQRELITEAHTIVEQTEADNDVPILRLLVERHSQLIIVVTDLLYFTPYRFPSLVESGSLCILHREAIHQTGVVLQFES